MIRVFHIAILIGSFFSLVFFSKALAQQTPEQIIDQAVSDSSSTLVSCPVQGGKIITSSYDADPVYGHCGKGYLFSCTCGSKGRRAKAIDIDTSAGQDVVLPSIGGKNIDWKLVETLCAGAGSFPNCSDSNGGTGALLTFRGVDPGTPADKWYIQFVHMNVSSLKVSGGGVYKPGTVVGKTDSTAHVHATIGKNLNEVGLRVTGVDDCGSGWMASDFMCDPSKQPPPVSLPGTTPAGPSAGKSNKVCTKAGNPTDPNPCFSAIQPGAGLAAGDFVHYCQNDPKWEQNSRCAMSASGCGPTSLAMVLSSFGIACNGGACTPAAVDKLMDANGQRNAKCESVMNGGALSSKWLKDLGVESGPDIASGGKLDYERASELLARGYLIIGSSGRAPSCNCDHIFVLQKVDPSTKQVVVRDPVCKGGQEVTYDYNNITWSYAIPIRSTKPFIQNRDEF